MDIDRAIATALHFPKSEYVAIERERRWLCHTVPSKRVLQTETIVDLYVTGTRLRLRDARPVAGGAPMLRLSRKADVDSRTRLITSIYLPETEFNVLAAVLPGARLTKLRHRLLGATGIRIAIDEFCDHLQGLILAEAEFDTPELLAAFPAPDFAVREVTDDPRFTGVHLAQYGRPEDRPS
jgi:CYTH domain-containing protein